MKSFLLILLIILLKEDESVLCDESSTKSIYNFLTPSLFPQIGPVFRFRRLKEPSNKIPNPLKKELLWRRTKRSYDIPATHSLLRHAGFEIRQNLSEPTIGSFDIYGSSNNKKDKLNHVFKSEYEKINHIPNVLELDDKILLSNNLNNMVKKFGAKNFPFIIPTYAIPNETSKFIEIFNEMDDKLWVQKPSNLSRSFGIKFFSSLQNFSPNSTSVVQKYIENPILIEGRKAEVRRYILVTGFDPIKIFSFGDELIKVSHRKYSNSLKTLRDKCIHTPYYLQCKVKKRFVRKSAYFVSDPLIKKNFKAQKLDWVNVTKKIDDAIIKIFFSAEKSIREASYATLKNRYNAFNLMGFDFFIDKNFNVLLNEVNRRPGVGSLTHDKIGNILADTFNIAGLHLPPNLSESGKENISKALDLKIDPSFNEKFYSFNLTGPEIEKHKYFESNFKLTDVDSYAAKILEDLTNDDIRVLMIAEDEINRMSKKVRRIFPSSKTNDLYMKYLDTENCYYYMLFSAWENINGNDKDRKKAIAKLREASSKKNILL